MNKKSQVATLIYLLYFSVAVSTKINGQNITLIPNPDGHAGVKGYLIPYNNALYFKYQSSDFVLGQYNGINDSLIANPDAGIGYQGVVVPLKSDTKKLLINKYNMQMPQVSNLTFNYYIKEVVRLAGIDEMIKITRKLGNKINEETRPKYSWIMSHTCRRSFCSNEFLMVNLPV